MMLEAAAEAADVATEMSTKQILLLLAPVALLIVSFPSETVTVLVPSTQCVVLDGLPLTVSTPSTLSLKMLSIKLGSPDTTWTLYAPLGSETCQTAFGFDGFCMC